MATGDPREIVEALAAHEETLSAVYTAYAGAYPEVRALWRTMAAEEFMHGKLLRSMLDRPEDLQAYVEARDFDLDEITAETKKLRTFAALAAEAGLPMQDAFRSAIRFESSLIESEVLRMSEGDTPEMAAVLGTLKEQTERHQRRLSESLATYQR
jgi:hypothetical protein